MYSIQRKKQLLGETIFESLAHCRVVLEMSELQVSMETKATQASKVPREPRENWERKGIEDRRETLAIRDSREPRATGDQVDSTAQLDLLELL